MKKTEVAMRSIETGRHASVLRSALRFLGHDLTSAHELVIEGSVKAVGVHHRDKLTIARNAIVEANVHARVVTIEGRIEGDVVADELVHLARSAHVLGSISAPSVTLEEGAGFSGPISFRAISRSGNGPNDVCITGSQLSISVVPSAGTGSGLSSLRSDTDARLRREDSTVKG